jgi:hypothetical protein
MHILIDARSASRIELPIESTLADLYRQWALSFPDHQFTWLLQSGEEAPELPNIRTILAPALPARFGLLRHWYRKSLPTALKDEKPDWLVPVHGFAEPGLNIAQRCWLLRAPGRHFLEQNILSRWRYRRQLPAMLQHAKGGWLNETGWDLLETSKAGIDRSEWMMLPPVAVSNNVAGYNESSRYDIDYLTGGRPFFASYVAGEYPADTLNLMKSFSLFKKRQQSDWKLMLIGDRNAEYKELKRAIAAYKYRDDVVLLEASEAEKLTALELCYALVQGAGQHLPITLLSLALSQGTALILPEKSPRADWLGEAPLYAHSDEITDIAECMMRVYKEEELIRHLRLSAQQLYRRLSLENLARQTFRFL